LNKFRLKFDAQHVIILQNDLILVRLHEKNVAAFCDFFVRQGV